MKLMIRKIVVQLITMFVVTLFGICVVDEVSHVREVPKQLLKLQ